MLIPRGLLVAFGLGLLVHDAAAAAGTPACCINKCGKAVGLNKSARKDCSAVLIKTYTPPAVTTTRNAWITKTVYRGALVKLTASTDVTETATVSETDVSVSTSLSTAEDTQYSTDTATVTETEFSTVTVPFSASATTVTVIKRGVSPRPKTRAVWKTVTTTVTTLASVRTNIKTVTVTTVTTVVSGTQIVETSTVTVGTTVDTTVTSIVVATETAAAPGAPASNGFPCGNTGFSLIFDFRGEDMGLYLADGSGGSPNEDNQGYIIKATPSISESNMFTLDANGNPVSYGFRPVTRVGGSAPYRIYAESSRVRYTFDTQPLDCQIGSGPSYQVTCKVGGVSYKMRLCSAMSISPHVYLFNDGDTVSGQMNCVGNITPAAVCLPGQTAPEPTTPEPTTPEPTTPEPVAPAPDFCDGKGISIVGNFRDEDVGFFFASDPAGEVVKVTPNLSQSKTFTLDTKDNLVAHGFRLVGRVDDGSISAIYVESDSVRYAFDTQPFDCQVGSEPSDPITCQFGDQPFGVMLCTGTGFTTAHLYDPDWPIPAGRCGIVTLHAVCRTVEEPTASETTAPEPATSETTAPEPAARVPPSCGGDGMVLRANSPGAPFDGHGLGTVRYNVIENSVIYRGAWAQFSGSEEWTVDADGNIVYPSYYEMFATASDRPYRIIFRSNALGTSYTFPTQPASCRLGSGPSYPLICYVAGVMHNVAACPDASVSWAPYLYTDIAQLSGRNCKTGTDANPLVHGVCEP
ncbi:hypothetical protein DRE_07741 [Drechslerella stenobrocha 248]|uniref:Uncharacterized protein n=1 Tax=Drechslerella stenobrocha 248 TaxID=1043628 RepID=W7I8W8_9PEZI|nr:hypothetical protein DRE_07741 [Drechslerella stenobrocha 248]